MDNRKTPDNQPDSSWMDELLPPQALGQEIGPDEQAVEAAGLIRPEDAELEQIIAEAKRMDRAFIPEESFLPDPEQADEFSPFREEPPVEAVDEGSLAMTATDPQADSAPVLFIPDTPLGPEDAPPPRQEDPNAPIFEVDAAYSSEISQLIPEAALLKELFPDDLPEEPLEDTSAEDDDMIPVWDRDFEPEIFGESGKEAAADPQPAEDYLRDEPPAEDMLTDESTRLFPVNMDDAYSDADPDAPDPEAQPAAPVRKARPKMKKGYGLFGIPHILSTVIWLAITVAIGVSLGRTLWVCAADVLAFGREEASAVVTITDSDNMETIAAKLKNAGLIKYPGLFQLYAGVAVDEGEISPGTYTLSTLYDYHALVKSMNQYSSVRQTVEVVIPEGYTAAQIFALLEENAVCTVQELEEYSMEGELKDYWFLESVERNHPHCLEGYLFPDTYEFYVDDSPGRVLGKLLGDRVGGFEVRFTELMEEKLVTLNERLSAMMKKNGYDQEYIDAHQMTIREVVIVASMIEKESTGADAYDISSVIYNRLTNAKNYPYLNIDATIIYALDGNIDPETGKTMPLTAEDLKLDDPYNTYLYTGLIPGPIANPGTASLLAALDPNDTDYYYYVYNYNTGVHLFGRNAKEHEKNVEKARSGE